MEACSNRKGEIADAREVGLSQQNSPYVCVNLRGRWQWRPVNKISGKTFKEIQGKMYKYIHNCLQEKITGEKGYSVMISNCITSSANIINGKWNPCNQLVKEGEFNVYSDERNLRYLYCVRKLKDGVVKFQWWIGVTDNMNQRKSWGFCRQKIPTSTPISPWQVNKWMCWNMPGHQDGQWLEHPIKVEKIDNEWKINKAIEIKTKKLAKQTQETIDSCNAVMNSAKEMANKHKEVSRELFNKLTKQERFAVVDTSKFRAVFKKDDLCSCCFSDAKTTKCIHQDCTGACATCRGDNEDADFSP